MSREELRDDFLLATRGRLDTIAGGLALLDRRSPAGADARDRLAAEAHTIGGGALVVGLQAVADAAVALEQALRTGAGSDAAAPLLTELERRLADAAVNPANGHPGEPGSWHGRRATRKRRTLPGDSVRVYVVEDHPLYREAVADMIRESDRLELTGQAGDGERALEEIPRLEPDVVLLDVRLPGASGIEVVEELGRRGSRARAIFISAVLDAPTVYRALAAGALGYLGKHVQRTELVDAVVRAAAGDIVLSQEAQQAIATEVRHRALEDGSSLTRLERDVLRLFAAGGSETATAEQLLVSPATVQTRLRSASAKLGVSGRTEAVAEAGRRGLLG